MCRLRPCDVWYDISMLNDGQVMIGVSGMPRKSASMIRANRHTVVLFGRDHKIVATAVRGEGADQIVVLTTADGTEIRRSPGAKLEVR